MLKSGIWHRASFRMADFLIPKTNQRAMAEFPRPRTGIRPFLGLRFATHVGAG
jgi:hypothetical protein